MTVADRVAVWDAALAAVRTELRRQGLCEVTTPVRLDAVALEPWIEPVAADGGWLATSPELPMKRLLCRGAPSIFQIAHCFRRGERGQLHHEEFHLVEWYRHGDDLAPVQGDVERICAAVTDAVANVGVGAGVGVGRTATTWSRHGVLDLIEATTGVALRGDEDPTALRAAFARVSAPWAAALPSTNDATSADDRAVSVLDAWTSLWSAWSDAALDPWLAARGAGAVHVVDFPAPLAALAQARADARGRSIADRFESYVVVDGAVVELANGYRELRDAAAQARRFAVVAGLRARHGLAPSPMPEAFLADLRGYGLPACAGAALGLDRLLVVATGRRTLDELDTHLGAPR